MPVTGCVVLLSELSVTHLCGWIALFVHDLGSRLVQSAVGPTPTAGDLSNAVVPRSSPSVHRAPRHVAARDFEKNMSPASSGALELERYVGACLISSQQGRHKIKINNLNRQQHHHAGGYTTHHHRPHQHHNTSGDQWAGGMPLISFSNPPQGWRRPHQENNPLARLAQGAPLILSNRYNHRKNNKPKLADSANKNKPPEKDGGGGGVADTVSVTSDESSGSANSENCLPRIIKPRKRRKKDRKPPPHLLRPISQDGSFSTDSASPDLDSPFLTLMPYFSSAYLPPYKSSPEIFADPCGDTPNLHHSFEDIQDFDVNGNQTESSCQCRYCDPTGQIWDIDRSCYSPYLTSPTQNAFQYPESASLLSKSYSSSSMSSSSLAENMSSLSLDEPTRDLEVSTEIVTSLNGHRDLEIRFFTSKADSSASGGGGDKDDAENCAARSEEKNVNGYVAEE